MVDIASPSAVPGGVREEGRPGQRARSLYRTVWRWHFYAGLLCIPVLVVMCLSGIVYLFKPQLNSLLHGSEMHVTPQATAQPFQTQVDAVETRYPDSTISEIFTPDNPGRATQLDIRTKGGKDLSVWVNPYTAKVQGARDNGHDPVRIALTLHTNLLTGKFLGDGGKYGNRLIEMVAGWTVVLVVTGLYLWWPRDRRKSAAGPRRTRLGGVLSLRRDSGNRRVFWRDLHAVTGVLFSMVMMFFLITGMAWTGYWGSKFGTVAANFDGFTGLPYSVQAKSTVGELLPNGRSPWGAQNMPVLTSAVPISGDGTVRWAPNALAPLDAIVSAAQQAGMTGSIALVAPQGPTGSWFIGRFSDTDGAPNRSSLEDRIIYVDQYSAKVLDRFGYRNYGTTGKIYDTCNAIHDGRQFGIWSQLMALTGALSILLVLASSLVMWRKRRPRGLGAPAREPDRRVALGVVVIMAFFGVLFPMVGLSMVALLVLEYFVLRRVPPVARALGITRPKVGAGVEAD